MPGCGCLSVIFVEKARNNFSFIVSNSESANEFVEALKMLPRHAHDKHKWDRGKYTFHSPKVWSCVSVKMMQMSNVMEEIIT